MNLRLRTLDFILTLQLQEAWSVATTFPVNMKAITQKDSNSIQAYTKFIELLTAHSYSSTYKKRRQSIGDKRYVKNKRKEKREQN